MYTIYREDAQTNQITLMTTYCNYTEANIRLYDVATEYFLHRDIKRASYTADLNDQSFVAGFYLRPAEQAGRLNVYHKLRTSVPGFLWNGQSHQVTLVMWFGIVELTQNPVAVEEPCKQASQKFKRHGDQVLVIEELRKVQEQRRLRESETDFIERFSNSFRTASPTAFAQELALYVARRNRRVESEQESDSEDEVI
jgi:hypothetical protein